MGIRISVIIPTYNEEKNIARLISSILACVDENLEIIVSDGGSTDETEKVVKAFKEQGVSYVLSQKKGRAAQMNTGAEMAIGNTLVFIHADSIVESNMTSEIRKAFIRNVKAGSFRLRFDSSHWFFNISTWMARLPFAFFKAGDQGLFIFKDLFSEIGGFNEDLIIFEDQDIAQRIQRKTRMVVIPTTITTSALKFKENGYVKLHFIYLFLMILNSLNVPAPMLKKIYKKFVKQNKV